MGNLVDSGTTDTNVGDTTLFCHPEICPLQSLMNRPICQLQTANCDVHQREVKKKKISPLGVITGASRPRGSPGQSTVRSEDENSYMLQHKPVTQAATSCASMAYSACRHL